MFYKRKIISPWLDKLENGWQPHWWETLDRASAWWSLQWSTGFTVWFYLCLWNICTCTISFFSNLHPLLIYYPWIHNLYMQVRTFANCIKSVDSCYSVKIFMFRNKYKYIHQHNVHANAYTIVKALYTTKIVLTVFSCNQLHMKTQLILSHNDPLKHPHKHTHTQKRNPSCIQKHHTSFPSHSLIHAVLKEPSVFVSFVTGVIIAWMDVSNNRENGNCVLTVDALACVHQSVWLSCSGPRKHYLHKLDWEEISTSQNLTLHITSNKTRLLHCINLHAHTATCARKGKILCYDAMRHTEMCPQPDFLNSFWWKINKTGDH